MGSSAPSSVWIFLVVRTHLNYPYSVDVLPMTLNQRTHAVDGDEIQVLAHALVVQSTHADDDDHRVALAK